MTWSSPLRHTLPRFLRWYLRHGAPEAGRGRLMALGSQLLGTGPHVARATDGRRFSLSFPRDRGWESLYFTGTFETGTTHALERILQPDDVTIDVGANLGWYTTLFGRCCHRGHCHAFEPEPTVFAELQENCALNDLASRVTLNELALLDQSGTATIHRFADTPHGHSSLSPTLGNGAEAHACRVTTLDRYCADARLDRLDLIKVDAEGAELNVLRGSEHVLSRPTPPIWLLEVNFDTSRAFGYEPGGLFSLLTERGEYHFFRVVGGWGAVLPVGRIDECGPSDNVFCVPRARLGRLATLL